MEEMEILKGDKDFEFLVIMFLISMFLLISVTTKSCTIKEPHIIYDSIYMGVRL